MPPPDALATQTRLQDIRLRILNGDRVQPDEMRELLSDLRRDRENASRSRTRAKAKGAGSVGGSKPAIDLNELFPT